ncbi:MAG TPA: aminotransferase class V-fold PLP-dependent enzyme [Bryobacteraceae bacterium]
MPQNTDHFQELLADVAARGARYLESAQTRRVSPEAAAVESMAQFDADFPEDPVGAMELVELLDRVAAPATVINAGGRYFGFVNGGALPGAVAASWLVDAWDQNAGMRISSPVGGLLEEVALRWTAEVLGLPASCGGGIVTGATMANFSAILAARHALLARQGWEVEKDGMFGAPPVDVVVSEEVHASVLKAFSLAGFGRERLRRVPVDDQGRMRADAMPALKPNTLVAIQAGNVNTGSFDPAREICARAREAGAWVHVDGAFGLWAGASPKYRHLTDGFALADSWATDGHKWPNAGYDCGIVLVKDPAQLRAAMAASASYLVTGPQRDPMNYAPDMSRRARGIEFWATLRSLGRRGLAELIERTCSHAQRFADGFREAGFAVLNDVVINQVLVSFGTPEDTLAVIKRIQEDGTCWAGSTVWQGRTAMRISVSSWATTEEDVERSLAAILRAAGVLRTTGPKRNGIGTS